MTHQCVTPLANQGLSWASVILQLGASPGRVDSRLVHAGPSDHITNLSLRRGARRVNEVYGRDFGMVSAVGIKFGG